MVTKLYKIMPSHIIFRLKVKKKFFFEKTFLTKSEEPFLLGFLLLFFSLLSKIRSSLQF